MIVHLFRFTRKVLQLLPAGLVLGTAGALGRCVGLFCRRERRISDTQLRFAFNNALTAQERRQIVDDSFAHGGKFWLSRC